MKKTAPGHVSLCMVIGNPIQYSLSPLMHNAAYRATGLSERFYFGSATVPEGQTERVFQACKLLGVRGLSVTLPSKEAIVPCVDELDEAAKEIGCVNTIVFSDGIAKGYNTDWHGIVDPIAKRIALTNTRCLIIGAGGAARAAAYGLSRLNAKVSIMNRTEERAQTLADDFSLTVVPFEDEDAVKEAAVIIQTTSVGLGDTTQCPIDTKLLQKHHLVFDAVYNPLRTKLLCDAQLVGAEIIEGIEMFVSQGAAQFQLYTEHEAPYDVMKEAVLSVLMKEERT